MYVKNLTLFLHSSVSENFLTIISVTISVFPKGPEAPSNKDSEKQVGDQSDVPLTSGKSTFSFFLITYESSVLIQLNLIQVLLEWLLLKLAGWNNNLLAPNNAKLKRPHDCMLRPSRDKPKLQHPKLQRRRRQALM